MEGLRGPATRSAAAAEVLGGVGSPCGSVTLFGVVAWGSYPSLLRGGTAICLVECPSIPRSFEAINSPTSPFQWVKWWGNPHSSPSVPVPAPVRPPSLFPFLFSLFPHFRGITLYWWVCLCRRPPWGPHWGFCIRFGDPRWRSGGCPGSGTGEHGLPAVPRRRQKLPPGCRAVLPRQAGPAAHPEWVAPYTSARPRRWLPPGCSGSRSCGLGEELMCLIATGDTCTWHGSRSVSPEACPINVTAGTAGIAGCWLFYPVPSQ